MPQSNYRCETLTSFSDVQKIATEWNALYQRAGKPLFRDFAAIENWWLTLGREPPVKLHVAIARSPEGELKALWPLVLRKQSVLSIVEQAGSQVFDNGDVLAETPPDAEALLHYVLAEDKYDIAMLKDIKQSDLSFSSLSASLCLHRQHTNYYLTLNYLSGAEWLAAQSRKLRGDLRRKTKKMEGHGGAAYQKWHKGEAVPDNVVDALFEQKRSWVQSHDLSGSCFLRPAIKDFLHGLVRDTARNEDLYLAWIACGGSIAACHLGFIRNNVLSLYITTYDPEFAAFSPGTLLMVETIKDAIDSGLKELDFMRGDEEYKQHFSDGHRLFADFAGGRSLTGKVVIQLRRMLRGTR